ncbi:MAG TPA: response regulator [Blastocatellia bacterium]|nr:response regulator [Blastocatellia bacterium]
MNTAQWRILLIEDREDACARLSLSLNRSGFVVTPVSDIREVWSVVQRDEFDLCILGSRLAHADGYDLCQLVRRLNPEMPIICFSADASPDVRQRALAAGASACLIEPIAVEDVRAAIAPLLKAGKTGSGLPGERSMGAAVSGAAPESIEESLHGGIRG